MAEPNPSNVAPWYLRNINQALGLDETTGNVYMRTGFTGNIVIEGNVNIPGNVEISNDVGNPVPVSGTVTIDTITSNVNVTQATSPWIVSGNVNANISGGNVTSSFQPTATDAFGRLRVSNPFTLFDTRSLYYDHELFASNLVGSGTVVYNANSSTYLMTVNTTGDAVYRETYKTFVYQPGKSLLVMNTFSGNTPTGGVTQRVGYFNDENGIFFEVDGINLNMVIRSSSSGSITYERIPQSAWNGDRLTGLGGINNPSGIQLNPALDQIFWIDIEWLGVGSVRTGFVINGQFITCHTFNHSNQPGNTTTYMGTAILPCRYELISNGAAATMNQVCSTVISEGGYQLSGSVKSIGHNFGQQLSLPNNQSYLPLISIRLKSNMPDAVVIPTTYSISVGSNDLYIYRIYRRAITTGGTWVNAGNDTAIEYNLSPTTLVSGVISESGYIRSSNQTASAPSREEITFENQLTRDPFTNTRYEFVITCATDGTNQTAYAGITWQDIS